MAYLKYIILNATHMISCIVRLWLKLHAPGNKSQHIEDMVSILLCNYSVDLKNIQSNITLFGLIANNFQSYKRKSLQDEESNVFVRHKAISGNMAEVTGV